jgi:hypothetical protein
MNIEKLLGNPQSLEPEPDVEQMVKDWRQSIAKHAGKPESHLCEAMARLQYSKALTDDEYLIWNLGMALHACLLAYWSQYPNPSFNPTQAMQFGDSLALHPEDEDEEEGGVDA